jgi:hypothetical protein
MGGDGGGGDVSGGMMQEACAEKSSSSCNLRSSHSSRVCRPRMDGGVAT